jgi:hypothetical protein
MLGWKGYCKRRQAGRIIGDELGRLPMTNTMNGKRIEVAIHPGVGASIWLPYSTVPGVCKLLDQHQIRYTVDEHTLSMDDGPEMSIIRMGRKVNAVAVQAILDAAGS